MVSGFGLAGEVWPKASSRWPFVVRDRAVPTFAPRHHDLDSALPDDVRTQRLELRVWVEGEDLSSQAVDDIGNSLADPLAVWLLEQRVADVVFDGAPTEDLVNPVKGGELIWSYSILNEGRGPGDVQIIVEVVEADGSRTRLDARSVSIGAGEVAMQNGTGFRSTRVPSVSNTSSWTARPTSETPPHRCLLRPRAVQRSCWRCGEHPRAAHRRAHWRRGLPTFA